MRLCRRAVHEHVDVAAHQPSRRDEDEYRDEEGRNRVGSVEADCDQDQACDQSERTGQVAREVERVRFERRAPVAAGGPKRDARTAGVDRDHGSEDDEGPPGGVDLGMVAAGEPVDSAPGDEDAHQGENRGLGESAQVLGLPVPVRVASVGGPDGDADGKERQQGGDEIGPGVRRLGQRSRGCPSEDQ